MARKGAAYSRARSATARRARSVSIPAISTVERDFSGGITSDIDPQAVPSGKMLDCADFMLDKVGRAYKRGGTQYFGPALTQAGSAGGAVGVAYAPFTSAPQLLAITHPGIVELYNVTSAAMVYAGTLGADSGFIPIQSPIFIQSAGTQYVIFPFGNGTSVPKRYNGSTIAALDASAPPARYGCVYKSRLVLGGSFANENRLWFSPIDQTTGDVILGVWDTAGARLDVNDKITGMAALMNSMLVFTRGNVERIVGDTPPPGGNMDRGVIANYGCIDARTIVSTGRSCIFANEQGIYATADGISFSDLTQEGLISYYWRSLTVTPGLAYVAGMLGDLYIITVLRTSDNAFMGGFVCNVPRRAWWKITNVKASMYATPIGSANAVGSFYTPELFASDRTTNRLLSLGSFTTPNGIGTDAAGASVLPFMTTRYFGSDSPWRKQFADGRLSYDLNDTTGGTPTLNIDFIDMSGVGRAAVNGAMPVTAERSPIRKRFSINRVARSVRLLISQTAKSDYTELFAIELDSRDQPPSELGEV